MSRRIFSFWFIILPNIALLYVGLWLSIYLRYPGGLSTAETQSHFKAFSILFVFWLLVLFIHGLFEVGVFRRYTTLFFNLISATVANLLIAIIYFYIQPNLILTPRRFLLIDIALSFLLLFFWDIIVKYFLKNRLTEDIYLFSFNQELKELEDAIKEQSYLGYRVLGHLNTESISTTSFDKDSGIILPENLNTNQEVAEQFYQLRTLGVKFFNHKDFYEQLLRRVYLSQLNEIWFLENIDYQEKRFYNIVKRIVDILLSVIGFVFFLVSLPFMALLIKLTSKGDIFFVQERVGKKGEVFKVYKYRTMESGTETNTWTSVNDPRITKFGKFLRKSRIDEWPQFINLLLGHMSIVGPRPEQPHIVEDLKKQIPFYDERHLVKPGLTGWAQLNIYAGSLEESKLKLQYDLYYIKNRSFFFDSEIILKTIYYIFTWQGR